MKARAWVAGTVGVLLIAGAVAWWLHAYHRVAHWVDLPRTGEAATDPLFALRLTLQAQGRTVIAARRLDPATMRLSPRDTVVFDGDPRALSPRVVGALHGWLRRGGHLVVAVPPPDPAADVFEAGDARHLPVPLLEAFGVRVQRSAVKACVRSTDLPAALCGARRFDAPAGTVQRIGDGAGDVVARVRVPGGGTLDVLASLRFLDTDVLEVRGQRALPAQLFTAGDPRGTVHLVHADAMPSLWRTLVTRGWPVWAPLALLLAGALWARMQRFGPRLPSPVPERRSLLEHVAASGRHQWRYGRAEALHRAVRDAFLARLRRRDPQAAALEGEVQIARLVERLGLPAASIRDALRPPDPRDAKSFVARIATLVRMGNRL